MSRFGSYVSAIVLILDVELDIVKNIPSERAMRQI